MRLEPILHDTKYKREYLALAFLLALTGCFFVERSWDKEESAGLMAAENQKALHFRAPEEDVPAVSDGAFRESKRAGACGSARGERRHRDEYLGK